MMKLEFEDYLSSKMSIGNSLTVFPDGDPQDYRKESTEKHGGESSATKNVYEFPDDFAVIVRTETGSAVMMPDEPIDVSIEVHIGKYAPVDIANTAESRAREMATEAGIDPDVNESSSDMMDYPHFAIVRH